ncbi:hypothetical protein Q2T42_30915 [Leptolyngbya boryana CZ1]|uniref:Protein translocase subunit SecDF P1 domain-containing protein n=1 Tax=Leptolyngbya boryana CZ1 TaxID=3060204 RepID=A0AA96WY12_LEPBY|nr:hypothetical protein [Leptolyngbya boryana]WNZ46204.1 hypothetical protein Q2T42_30915 [Leptolyngbya boryana CZ1]
MVLAIYIIVDERHFPTLLGLDLRGGSQITIQVKPTAEIKNITSEQLGDVQRVIEGRINGLGVSEPLVQTAGENQIHIQLPGVSDPEQAELMFSAERLNSIFGRRNLEQNSNSRSNIKFSENCSRNKKNCENRTMKKRSPKIKPLSSVAMTRSPLFI